MSLSTQTQRRLPTIQAGLLTGLTYDNIGKKCGVTKRTIDRDIKTWIESGQFETWIKEEWLRLHTIILHEDPREAYRQITKLVTRMVTRKMEVKEEVSIEETHVMIDATENEADILSKAASILERKAQSESIH